MGFRIDGSDYEIPEFDSFTMGEAMILYDNTKLSLDGFVLNEDDPKQVEQFRKNILHPGTVLTRMVVAYMRANPGLSRQAAEAVLDKANWAQAYADYLAEFGSDVDPPEQSSSESATDGDVASKQSSSDPSGGTSSESSVRPAEIREITGTSGLATYQDLPPAA